MTTEEVKMYEKVQCKYNKFWVPLVWANTVLTEARREGKIESDIGFRLLLEVRGFGVFVHLSVLFMHCIVYCRGLSKCKYTQANRYIAVCVMTYVEHRSPTGF